MKKYSLIAAVVLIVIATAVYLLMTRNNGISMEQLNANLHAEGLQIGMTEENLISLWGEGKYDEGFGGHGRRYEQRMGSVGIAGDQDNNFYGKVSSFTFSNSDYKVFDISIGNSIEEASGKLESNGFTYSEQGFFESGEFFISLRGESVVEFIQIWFSDKDLRDRIY